MWAGLGYYARARNLHKCAGVIRDEHQGSFPTDEATLLKLPGIGPYTAATIAAICADEATNIVDGNVERVISRVFTFEDALPKGRKALRALAGTLVRPERPGKKKPTPIRYGHVYVLQSGDHFLVEQRPDKGLLGGMLGLPTSEWGEKPTDHSAAPVQRNWQKVGEVKHVFTHFELRLDVFLAEIDDRIEGEWRQEIRALPTVFKKAARLAHEKTRP